MVGLPPEIAVIDGAAFGSVTINGIKYDHDIYVLPNGKVMRRDMAPSRLKYGSSHTIPQEEIEKLITNVEFFVLGTGHSGVAKLSGEAKELLKERKLSYFELKTPEAVKKFNEIVGAKAALIHVTC